jgi:integrase
MPRKKNPVPSYQLHKPTGQAFVRIPDGAGGRKYVYLGKHDTDESRAEYERVLAELRTGNPNAGGRVNPSICVAQVLAAFIRHAEQHYRRPDGTPTQEVAEYKRVASYILRVYADVPAAQFGPLALKTVREKFLAKGQCRYVVNKRTNRIRQIFKLAVGEELIPGSVWESLRAVAGLSIGRTTARETEPIAPVPVSVVNACIPHLLPPVRAMVELQLFTGMRPNEVVSIRPADVDMSGPVWVYRPRYHKLSYRGKPRAIAIGPKSQAILKQFTPSNPDRSISRHAMQWPRIARAGLNAGLLRSGLPTSQGTNASG